MFAESSHCHPDLKMGSPHARNSKRRPNVPVKAIPMSLYEGGREGEGGRVEKREEGRETKEGRGGRE